MKLPALFKNREQPTTTSKPQLPWQWQWQWRPSCKHPQTLSFRAGDDVFKTVNSVFFDHHPTTIDGIEIETPESWFTNSSSISESGASFSTESEYHHDGESLEMVVRGAMKSERRLFFEPGGDTSSILEEAAAAAKPIFEETSVVVVMESEDPYVDFRRSMEEMVETHGIKDWECLEELLGLYLKVNCQNNHGFIIGAFIDLLLANSTSTACSHHHYSTSYSSAVSSFASSPLCSTDQGDNIHEIEEEDQNNIVLN